MNNFSKNGYTAKPFHREREYRELYLMMRVTPAIYIICISEHVLGYSVPYIEGDHFLADDAPTAAVANLILTI